MKQLITLGITLSLLTSCTNPLDKEYSMSTLEDDIEKIEENKLTDSAGIALLKRIPEELLTGEMPISLVKGRTYREIIYEVKERANVPEPLSVKEYHKTWLDNELKAEGLYKGKKVALSGKISGVGRRMITDIPYVDLDINFIDGFTCEFSEDDFMRLSELKKGDKIIIVGTGESGWTLKNCYFPPYK